MSGFWRRHLVTEEGWRLENQKHGSVYFAKDKDRDMVKIGHSSTPFDRLRVLQTGSAARLRLIGVMAAPRIFEATLHRAFDSARIQGEWFQDHDMVSLFLQDVTGGAPLCQTAWELVPGIAPWQEWDEVTKSYNKLNLDPGAATWEFAE